MSKDKTQDRMFLRELYNIWISEQPFHHAPGLAYYAIFSIVPIMYSAISVVDVFLDESNAKNTLLTRVYEAFGEEAVILLQESLVRVEDSIGDGSSLLSIVAFIALILTASLFFFQLQYVLNTIWNVPPPRRDGTKVFFQGRLLAFLIVLGIGGVLTVTILIQFLLSWLGDVIPINITIPFSNSLFFLVMATLIFAMIYKVLPNAAITWRDVCVGSFVTSVLFWIGMNLVLLYLTNSDFSSPQEAAGAVLVLLLAFYFLSTIFIFGAVFTRVFASMYGSQIVPQPYEISAEDQGQQAG